MNKDYRAIVVGGAGSNIYAYLGAFDVLFENCLIRNTPDNSSSFANITWNKDPKFKDYEKLNFELDTLSNAKDIGDPTWSGYSPVDLKNRSRLSDGKPDLGAYERNENK